MAKTIRVFGASRRRMMVSAALTAAFGLALAVSAQAAEPIKIGVIGEASSVAGASLTKAAEMAADDINAQGGVDGRKIDGVADELS